MTNVSTLQGRSHVEYSESRTAGEDSNRRTHHSSRKRRRQASDAEDGDSQEREQPTPEDAQIR